MRLLFILLSLGISYSFGQEQQPLQFVVTLTEQKSSTDDSNQHALRISSTLTCKDEKCNYSVTISNQETFFKVLCNNKEYQTSCSGSISQHETANITIQKANSYLDLLDFEYTDTGKVTVLGCETGLYDSKECTRISNTDPVSAAFWDELCICATFCSAITTVGECSSGDVTWWKAGSALQSSSVQPPLYTTRSTSVSTGTPPTPPTTTSSTPIFYQDIAVTLSETPTGSDEYAKVKVKGTINCTDVICVYHTTVDNDNPGYFTVLVDGDDCSVSSCSGYFSSGESVPVVVKRLSQYVDLFDYNFNANPTVLGCDTGMSQPDTCFTIISYNNEVCSCMGEQTDCDDKTSAGTCDSPWWVYDPTSSTSLGTTTLPPQDPNIFDLAFVLSEEGDNGNFNNVTITAFMNCSAELHCQYDVRVLDYAQTFYTILLNGDECPGSHCQGAVRAGQTARVTASRTGEILDVFDLQYITKGNVIVLGCSQSILSYGECQQVQNYDAVIQRPDYLCVCQSAELSCNGQTKMVNTCDIGIPIWWKSTTGTSSKSPGSTQQYQIKLTETEDITDQVVQANVNLLCDDSSCTYRIFCAYSDPEYFQVLINGKPCPTEGMDSSFLQVERIPVTVKRKQQILDWFEIVYKNLVVLGCSNGYLEDQDCKKISYYSVFDGVKDEVCSCQNADNECGISMDDASCSEGTTTWWRDDPAYSTSVGTTESPVQMIAFTVVLSEKNEDQNSPTYNQMYNLTMSVSLNYTYQNVRYQVDIVNEAPNYYTVLRNGQVCASPCTGNVSDTVTVVNFVVHRLQQHLDLLVFDYEKVMVAGCGAFGKMNILKLGNSVNDGSCLQVPGALNDDEVDNLCVCQGLGSGASCENGPPVGECNYGDITWWVDDPGRTTPKPTTTEDRQNTFQFQISLNETLPGSKVSHQFQVASTLHCSIEECSYRIDVINYMQEYFTVFAGNNMCDPICEDSFMQGKAVNVTVFRGEQKLDLFDFEYTDIPRVVVLGCEDGQVEYGKCISVSQTTSVNGEEMIDEVCSCRSTGLDCSNPDFGVCRRGTVKWWKDVEESTSVATTTTLPPTSTTPSTTHSTTVPTTPLYTPSLQNLANSTVGLNNVTQILNDTLGYSTEGVNLNGTQIYDISKVLHKSANVPGISADNAKQILSNIDACLNAHEKEIIRGHSKEFSLLGVMQPMVHNTVDNVIHYLHGKNMGFGAKKVDCKNIDSDDGLIDYGPDVGFAPLNDTNRLSATEHNSIIVPLKRVCQDNEQITHVFFTIYRGQKLFVGQQRYRTFGGEQSDPRKDELEAREGIRVRRDTNENDTSLPYPPPSKCEEQISVPQNVPVLSATLMNNGVSVRRVARANGPEEPIVAEIQINVGKMQRPLHGNLIVSWFDQGAQLWETREQCKVTDFKDGIVTATCEHLTDFSALVYGQLNAQFVCSTPLIIAGYVVNSISIACLTFLIIIGLMFYIHAANVSKVLSFIRGQIPTKGDIINLTYYCIFLMFFVLLIGFMDQSKREEDLGTTSTYCIVIASLSYFSLLSAILLSMLIGIRMVSHFFSPRLRVFFGVMTSAPAALSIGFVLPLTFTTILAIFDTSFFKRDDSFCWVRPDYVVYAVIVPITIPIINGLICSTFAVYKMFFQAKRGLANKETSHHDAEFWSKVFGLVIMQVAMGLPWGVEFIIIGISGSSAWNYVFVILLGTQGIDLFLIFLYRRQRLVNESKKWSAREQRFGRNSKGVQRARMETFMD